MYDMESIATPRDLTTVTRANPIPVQGNADMIAFLRQMAARRQMQAAAPPRLAYEPQVQKEERGPLAAQEDALRKAQLANEQSKLAEEGSIRTMRKVPVPMGPGGIYGIAYDWDTRSMTPGQVAAVSPQNATFAGSGAANSSARPQGADEDFQRFMADVAQRRAISASGGL